MVQWEKLEKKLIRTVGKNLKESDRQTREKPLKGGCGMARGSAH